MVKMPAPEHAKFTELMDVNNYQTILRIELNNRTCYSGHHLMVSGHFYCWVAGSFNVIESGIIKVKDIEGWEIQRIEAIVIFNDNLFI